MPNYTKISDHIEELIIDNPRTRPLLKWVNILNAGKNEINYLRRNFDFDLVHLKMAAASVSFQRPMIFNASGYLCLVLHFPSLKDGKISASEVDFFVGHGYLITVHNNTLAPINHLFNLGKKSPDSFLSYSQESSAILLYEILGNLIDSIYELVDENSVKINNIDDLIFNDRQEEAVKLILLLRSNIINIRRIMQSHKNILQKLLDMDSSLVKRIEIRKYYNTLLEHSERIWEILDNQKEMIDVLNNTNESLLNNHMTNVMKTLTIFSVIVLPLTLLSGVFGMNAINMPFVNLQHGFWMIVGIMLFIVIFMITLFRKKGWIK